MARRTILVVEDDPSIRRGVVDALACSGYATLESPDVPRAIPLALGGGVDLVLIDVMLPGRDGFDLLDELRRSRPALPVIMVTARGAESDRVRGLKLGADDYVVKPFSALELVARVGAVLRRSAERNDASGTIDLDGCSVDLETRRVVRTDGAERELSDKEAGVLHYLATRRGHPVRREELLQHVWGIDPHNVTTRTVDMHVARLRDKLGDSGSTPTLIRTVRGKGYLLA